MENNKKRIIFIIIAAVCIIAGIIAAVFKFTPLGEELSEKNEPQRMGYTEYLEQVKNGNVNIIFYNDASDYMTVVLYDETTQNLTEKQREDYDYNENQMYQVVFPQNDEFRKELLEQGVLVVEEDDNVNSFIDAYGTLTLYLLLFGFMFYFMAKANPASQKGYARAVSPKDINVTFEDVIGHEEIKEDLQLLVKQLKNGASDISHGVLFEGGAGTGKTMLAKAIAHEAGVNFLSVNSSNFVEMYVGLGAKRVRDVFKQAKNMSPCVLFFDEIDAVGAKRGSQRSHRENDQTINALLTELDGFSDKGNVLVIAATNLASELDEALLRSGRFDRKIKVEAPKKWETRKELFDHYLKEKELSDVNTEVLAKQTVGFSGADIAAICREASLIAFREDSSTLTHSYLEEAIDKMVFKGNRSNAENKAEDLKCVAFHEAGHAIMTLLTGEKVSRISIMGMTSGVGGAVFRSDNERFFTTKREYEAQVMIAYAGRAAEAIAFGDENVTQGASNDITQATQVLLSYSTKFGFNESMGLIDFDVLNGITINENLTKEISKLSNEFYDKTRKTLNEHFELVEALAEKLLEVKTLSGNEVTDFLTNKFGEDFAA